MDDTFTSDLVRQDWEEARRKALWAAIVDRLTKRPGELVPLHEVKDRLNIRGSHFRGLQVVPLDRIIGSEGRYADFDRRFLPRQEKTAQRWKSVNSAQYHERELPPIELYQISDVYFVKDGNHRVSVARQRGRVDIEAYVTEFVTDVPLAPSFAPRDLLLKEEYSDFLDWTDLARLRPGQRVELSELGGYLDLIQHINTHRYYLALERDAPVSAAEAVTSWYDHVYLPVVEAIRRHGLLAAFAERTEADLYLWIMRHRAEMRDGIDEDPGPEVAVLDYAERFRPRSLRGSVGEVVQGLAKGMRVMAHVEEPAPLDLLSFIAWSQIDRLFPDIEIKVTNVANIARLRQHIEDHQYYLGTRWQRPASRDEAVVDWCVNYYLPTIEAIREQHVLADWPGHTETDLYLEVMEQVRQLGEQGLPAGPREAAASFRERLGVAGRRRWHGLTRWFHLVSRWWPLQFGA